MARIKLTAELEKRLRTIEEKIDRGLGELAESVRAVRVRLVRSEMALAGVLFLCGALAKALIDVWVKGGMGSP